MENNKQEYDRLLNDYGDPFDKVSDADYLAELHYPDIVLVVTKKGDVLCEGDRCNAWQPDGQYHYYFSPINKKLQ